jgi:glycosyltransferase involved in cell wall biosynthesis
MISVVIPTLDSAELLALTLTALVPAAAEGIVREVVVVDAGSRDQTRRVADEAGCAVVEAGGPAGAMLAHGAATVSRGDFILFLRPGVILDPRWAGEAAAFVDRASRAGLADERAAVFRFEIDDLGASARLGQFAAAVGSRISGLPHPAQPLLVSRRFYARIGGHRPLRALEDVDLARRIGRTRIIRLRASAAVLARPDPLGPPATATRVRRGLSRALAALRLPTGLLVRLHG